MLFMTWAHRDGMPESGMADYGAMQLQIDNGYLAIAREQKGPGGTGGLHVVQVRLDHPDISLWSDDGTHSEWSRDLSSACVFFATIFRQSPSGLSYHGGIDDGQARILQDEPVARSWTTPPIGACARFPEGLGEALAGQTAVTGQTSPSPWDSL